MKSKSQKIQELKQLKDRIPDSKIVIFSSFSREGEKGLSVTQMTELKRSLRELDSEYIITKKTLADIAFRSAVSSDNGGPDIFDMNGSLGLTFGRNDDYYAVAKKLYEFSKKNPALQFFGAFMEGKFMGLDDFLEIAKMPSREVLLGRLVGMLTYPVRGLAVAMSEVAKKKEATI